MSIRLTVQFSVKEGQADGFRTFMGGLAARVKQEDSGCEMYDLFQSVDSAQRFALLESWATAADLEGHGRSAAMKALNAGIGPYLAGRPDIQRYEA